MTEHIAKQVTDTSTGLGFQFDNKFVRELPADPETDNHRRQVLAACFSYVKPRKVKAPELVAFSHEMAAELDLDEANCLSEQFTQVFAGNEILDGMQPYAQCYGGHQFGNWAGQLGDGRAINLGEVINKQGKRFCLQLKGAGETPYSRTADGLAVLRSSVREFLCSEAMHHLGIPTTRALSIVTTGENVMRDMFYDGRPEAEPGAVVCRVASSFLRLGSFEIFTSRGDIDTLTQLVNYTIETDFSHLGAPSKETYLAWFREICERTATMVTDWMRVGFVHGVFNTDNTSVLGLTIDYGPYGWIDDYDPNWTPNTTDAVGKRYRFGAQPQIAQWNLLQMANAIYPLIDDAEALRNILNDYVTVYTDKWQQMRADKLGLAEFKADDEELHQQLNKIMQISETDMTIFYRLLANIKVNDIDKDDASLLQPLLPAFYAPESLSQSDKQDIAAWIRSYLTRVKKDGVDDRSRKTKMNRVNPKYILRNYLSQLAIDKSEQGDHSLVNELLDVMRHPYDEQPEYEQYAAKRPDWARNKPGCSMLSCSS
ncbi:Selenoprotein O and cysteine-containing-like [Methylophaga thiooxydans]|uniref:Protein nucleotidyltransferase YdiU n=1 Tax=Methylophaga thiooxydans TaxID=392484 RepID=A0A0A0BBW4_9GAMM|nr:YdiU family protein [Methylophaga thiooxydans]KGM06083.1 Selenoprotein O and cysteine-containing-like [Methylophaga thiooxydans]